MNPTTPAWRTGVSPQHFTCLVVSARKPRLRDIVGAERHVRCLFVGRVGIEPTFFGVRDRCNNQLLLPPRSSHPLESNQNLLGFNQARRPTTREWDVTSLGPRKPRAASVRGCLPGHPSSSSTLRLSENAARGREAHLGRLRQAARTGRTSGGNAFATLANAPIADS